MATKRKVVSDDEDDYSDIDELVSDEDEDIKPTDVRSILKGGLTQPMHGYITMHYLHELCHTGQVDLNPSYQREVVWPEQKMIGLIQSLFLNYHVPPVLFAITVNENGEELHTCIDGKQRCTSILNFMDGKIPFVSPHTKEKYWYSMYGTKKRGLQLPEALKRKFNLSKLSSVEYRDITDMQQRDIFQRVQLGVSLSSAEKLQAIPGPWPTWVVELIKKYVLEPYTLGDKNVLDWELRRGRPFQNIAGFIILAHDPDLVSVPAFKQIQTFFARGDSPDRHFKRKVEMTLSLFVNTATDHFEQSFGVVQARVAPVEFVYVALLIFTRMGIFSISRLASYIGEMRVHIRQAKGHVDVRSNGRVSKDFADYVRSLPKKPFPNERPAAEEFEGDEVDPRNIRAAKRARRGEEEDPTYRGTAVDRFDTVGLGNATRNAKAASMKPAPAPTTASASARHRAAAAQLPPAAPVSRPPPSSMDREPIYGHPPVPSPAIANPYTIQYTGHQNQAQTVYGSGQQSNPHAANWGQRPNANAGSRWATGN